MLKPWIRKTGVIGQRLDCLQSTLRGVMSKPVGRASEDDDTRAVAPG